MLFLKLVFRFELGGLENAKRLAYGYDDVLVTKFILTYLLLTKIS